MKSRKYILKERVKSNTSNVAPKDVYALVPEQKEQEIQPSVVHYHITRTTSSQNVKPTIQEVPFPKVRDTAVVNNGGNNTEWYTYATDWVLNFRHIGISRDVIAIPMGVSTANLTAGDKASINAPYNFTLNSFWIGVETAPTGSSLIADLKKAGVSVASTKAGIDATEFTSLTGTAPVLTGDLTFAKGVKITPSVVQAGAVETGKNLIIYLEVTKV